LSFGQRIPLPEFWQRDKEIKFKIANSADLFRKKKLAAEIFGSDLILRDKKARGSAQNLWAALTARRGCLTVVQFNKIARTYFQDNN